MKGFDLLGATDAFADQLIVVRVKSIDVDRLKKKIGGNTGSAVSAALAFANLAPKAALDIALPVALGELKTLGIEADVTISNAPLPKTSKRAFSEFFPGLLIGGIVGGTGFGIAKLIGRLFRR